MEACAAVTRKSRVPFFELPFLLIRELKSQSSRWESWDYEFEKKEGVEEEKEPGKLKISAAAQRRDMEMRKGESRVFCNGGHQDGS